MRPMPRFYLALLASLLAAMILTIFPMSAGLTPLRPLWIVLTLLYWSLKFPHRVGLGWSWGAGLFLDIVHGGLIGQHPLALVVSAYLALRLHQRIMVFPVWQQAISIGAVIAVYMTIILWIDGMSGHPPGTWLYWAPLLTSVLSWPLVTVGLDRLCCMLRAN